MLGTIVNVVAVMAGSIIGLIFRKGISDRLSDSIMKAIGLCVVYIGISGALDAEKTLLGMDLGGKHTLIVIGSMAFGALIGTLLNLDEKINQLAKKLERRFQKADQQISIAEGFVTGSLVFCVGAMAVVGSLQSGLDHNYQLLFTKSALDFVGAIIFSSSLGIGVIFSSVFILVYQGSITLLAQFLSPVLTDMAISEMNCVGSLLIIGLGLNLLKVSNLKVMNYIPAIFLPILICLFL